MIEEIGKFSLSGKGKTGIIYVPSDIVKDSQFPLKEGRVRVKIDHNRLVIEEYEKK